MNSELTKEDETLMRCDIMLEVNLSRLRERRRKVSRLRQRAIVQKINSCFAFGQV